MRLPFQREAVIVPKLLGISLGVKETSWVIALKNGCDVLSFGNSFIIDVFLIDCQTALNSCTRR